MTPSIAPSIALRTLRSGMRSGILSPIPSPAITPAIGVCSIPPYPYVRSKPSRAAPGTARAARIRTRLRLRSARVQTLRPCSTHPVSHNSRGHFTRGCQLSPHSVEADQARERGAGKDLLIDPANFSSANPGVSPRSAGNVLNEPSTPFGVKPVSEHIAMNDRLSQQHQRLASCTELRGSVGVTTSPAPSGETADRAEALASPWGPLLRPREGWGKISAGLCYRARPQFSRPLLPEPLCHSVSPRVPT